MAARTAEQFPLFQSQAEPQDAVAVTKEVVGALQENAAVAIGVSGGKDSAVTALRTLEYLDALGHSGPRILIHSHLGRVEWQQSLPMCRQLADRVGLELVVVRRESGDLLDRWRQRWTSNVERYAALSSVRLMMPWSSAGLRFCTSELKIAPICRELVRRFPGRRILSVSGIRRDESPGRAKAEVACIQPRLGSSRQRTSGLDWHPILAWTLRDVLCYLDRKRFPLHEAYTRYLASRVSCAYCVLSSQRDLSAAAQCASNQSVYRELVALEVLSTFSFRADRWLGDIAPALLDGDLRERFELTKLRAKQRQVAEARIPAHLLYQAGWPQCLPSWSEARLLSEVRLEVAAAADIDVGFTQPETVMARYEELFRARSQSRRG